MLPSSCFLPPISHFPFPIPIPPVVPMLEGVGGSGWRSDPAHVPNVVKAATDPKPIRRGSTKFAVTVNTPNTPPMNDHQGAAARTTPACLAGVHYIGTRSLLHIRDPYPLVGRDPLHGHAILVGQGSMLRWMGPCLGSMPIGS